MTNWSKALELILARKPHGLELQSTLRPSQSHVWVLSQQMDQVCRFGYLRGVGLWRYQAHPVAIGGLMRWYFKNPEANPLDLLDLRISESKPSTSSKRWVRKAPCLSNGIRSIDNITFMVISTGPNIRCRDCKMLLSMALHVPVSILPYILVSIRMRL